MNFADFDRIEQDLQITLPQEYRAVMAALADELRLVTYVVDGESRCWFDEQLYLEAQALIDTNLTQRKRYSGTDFAFPNWWRTFVLFGSNGGGDYYCLRLDGQPGVWMIGSDCGNEPTLTHQSLLEYI